MKEEEKIITNIISNFVKEHWDKIDVIRCELKQSKEEFLEEVNTNFQTAMWVLSEVSDWGLKGEKKYFEELYVKQETETDFHVLKIEDKYIKMKWFHKESKYKVDFIEPKTKTVIYFE